MVDPINPFGGIGSTSNQRSVSSLAQNFDSFLLLLTTQLRHQDPTAPLDTNQFTQQLVSFAAVEQNIKTNDRLDELILQSRAQQVSSALLFKGATVEVESKNFYLRASPNNTQEIGYDVPAGADRVGITIKNEAGDTIYTGDIPKNTGRNKFVWDGKKSNGQNAPEGAYKVEINVVKQGNNTPLDKIYVKGFVTAVDFYGSEGADLMFNTVRVPLTKVRMVGI